MALAGHDDTKFPASGEYCEGEDLVTALGERRQSDKTLACDPCQLVGYKPRDLTTGGTAQILMARTADTRHCTTLPRRSGTSSATGNADVDVHTALAKSTRRAPGSASGRVPTTHTPGKVLQAAHKSVLCHTETGFQRSSY